MDLTQQVLHHEPTGQPAVLATLPVHPLGGTHASRKPARARLAGRGDTYLPAKKFPRAVNDLRARLHNNSLAGWKLVAHDPHICGIAPNPSAADFDPLLLMYHGVMDDAGQT
jgi:hypothetical protein